MHGIAPPGQKSLGSPGSNPFRWNCMNPVSLRKFYPTDQYAGADAHRFALDLAFETKHGAAEQGCADFMKVKGCNAER